MSMLLVFALLSSALAAVPLSSVQRTVSTRLVPNRFIVELDSVSDLPGKRNVHDAFYSALEKRAGGSFTVDRQFNTANVFVGAAISVSVSTLAQISQIPGVKAIRPVTQYPAPKPVQKIIPNGPTDPAVPPDSESTHVMTGVDKLHAEGIFGKGIKIGMYNSWIVLGGTDYNHLLLGGGFGPGKKVAGGFDFVGDAYNGTNTPIPDSDPLDQCNGHGTHVAGIIGANPGNQFNISGVAFDATIFSYRVFGCTGTVSDDIIIEALLRGVSDGVDILTLSLGEGDGWTAGMPSVVASRLADMGKILTIAAGNDGAFGSWFPSDPGNGIDVISVASVENTFVPVQNATTSDATHPTIPYMSVNPLPVNGSLPIFVVSNDTTVVDDACNPLPAGTPDLSAFLVIIRRGTCTFVRSVKLQNIADKGAKVSFIYNNVNGLTNVETGNFTTALIQAADGQFLVDQFIAGKKITVAFPQTGVSFNFPQPQGGLVSTFSSYGPTFDLFFKPAVAAPGGNILSTFPVVLGGFAILSGTSMATPFMAGSAALLLQVKGTSLSVARGARTRFETTAQAIPSSKNGGDPLQTLTQQGAGLINVFDAIHFETTVSPGELILNDTAHFVGSHTITVQNTGKELQKYVLTHVPAGTAATIQPDSIFAAVGPVPLTKDFANVRLSRTTLVIPPSGSAEVDVTITPPGNVDEKTFPVYTGFIQIQSVINGEILHVSYQGVAAALKDMTVIDNTNTFFGNVTLPTIMDGSGAPQVKPTNYTFVGSDFPTLVYRLASGTPSLLLDLVKPDLNLAKRALEERGLASDWTPRTGSGEGSFGEVSTIGRLAAFTFQPRSSNGPDTGGFSSVRLNATFANNSAIPIGQYRVLLRALKITGDPTDENDYETFLSPIVGVNG
ncbi:subtilisin-like protease [Gautieria morchelliformis]|nr:subtilisin-like protease [Gautieria morchelliformis]